MIEACAPGKLYIAGEYAVIEPGHPAVLVALNQFLRVRLTPAKLQGSIRSTQYGGLAIPWTRKNGDLVIDQRENPYAYITEAVKITERYLVENGKKLEFFDLEVDSDLDNQDGKKYGLGSSAAVTVATIKALFAFHDEPFVAEKVYKLAALAHLSIKSNGSFGDLAASTYGGWLAYACFDRQWVMEQQKVLSLQALIDAPWPELMIQPLSAPKGLSLLIGWTGVPASTTHLVDLLREEQPEISDFYQIFLKESKAIVADLIDAFHRQANEKIERAIQKNRTLLRQLEAKSNILIETPALKRLCDIAEQIGFVAKSSGAGGGDCGIVLSNDPQLVNRLETAWKAEHIQPLSLQVFHHSTTFPAIPATVY